MGKRNRKSTINNKRREERNNGVIKGKSKIKEMKEHKKEKKEYIKIIKRV